ncbi:hypothetical protein D3C78_1681540 [compost metagenome]
MRPRVGLKPNTPQHEAGIRIEPPASLPWANGTSRAATAAAAPPLEPPAECLRFHGLWQGPNSTGSVVGGMPNSGVLLRPTKISPAARKRRTSSLS